MRRAMRVGIGLPSAVPNTPPELLIEWAERADAGTFSSLGVVDRPRYDSYEPLSTLGLAASVTQRVGLVTMVVIGPLRNTALLAKETATLDAISQGRFTLGLGVGARLDDYTAIGIPTKDRGQRLTDQLVELRLAWEREEVARMTSSGHGPPLLVGGLSDMTHFRIARYADGYVHGGGPPRTFERAAARTRTAWIDLGRTGTPLLFAQAYFALGDEDVVERGRAYMRDYYAFTGPFAERIAEGMLSTPQAIAQFVRGYAEAGCDELVLLPAVADIEQVDRLQDVLADGVT
jgi:alkanesulfonate monooxygenase SsuD/methylene tetrahydromethanopterin reductase-like flavin-dependent oxidoreductase (luciferase family)